MADENEWRQMDDYWWSGPPGWTICRVGMHDGDRFEIWRDGAAVGSGKTLTAAQKIYAGLAINLSEG